MAKRRGFTQDGVKFTWRERYRYSETCVVYELLADGKVVPRDVLIAAESLEDEKSWRRYLAYWMASPGEDICCRYCQWVDVSGEERTLRTALDDDQKRKAIDPKKLAPAARLDLANRWASVALVLANLEEGYEAILEGREPEWLTEADFGLEQQVEQQALFTMEEEQRRPASAPRLTVSPAFREPVTQGSLL
ncbi:MAG: hypothetical protein AB7I50_23555 [Vicinamibacterales bacterium]